MERRELRPGAAGGRGATPAGVRARATVLAALALALDRASKLVVASRLPPGESLAVWPGVFHLTHVQNPGAAFGLLPGRDWLLIVVPVLVTAAALWVLPSLAGRYPGGGAALGLLVGGALGNLLDRLGGGLVIDFLDFRVWPVFNLADVFIVAGAGLLALAVVRGERDGRGASGRGR